MTEPFLGLFLRVVASIPNGPIILVELSRLSFGSPTKGAKKQQSVKSKRIRFRSTIQRN